MDCRNQSARGAWTRSCRACCANRLADLRGHPARSTINKLASGPTPADPSRSIARSGASAPGRQAAHRVRLSNELCGDMAPVRDPLHLRSAERPADAERRRVEARRDAAPIRHHDQQPPFGRQHAPDLAQHQVGASGNPRQCTTSSRSTQLWGRGSRSSSTRAARAGPLAGQTSGPCPPASARQRVSPHPENPPR